MRNRCYSVYLEGEEIEIIFYTLTEKSKQEREDYVKRSLIGHDHYDPNITVTEVKS